MGTQRLVYSFETSNSKTCWPHGAQATFFTWKLKDLFLRNSKTWTHIVQITHSPRSLIHAYKDTYGNPWDSPHEDRSNLLLQKSKENHWKGVWQIALSELSRICPMRVSIGSYISQKQELSLHVHHAQILPKYKNSLCLLHHAQILPKLNFIEMLDICLDK